MCSKFCAATKLVPLVNRGLTCYFNTALQVASHANILLVGKSLFLKDEGINTYQQFWDMQNYHQVNDAVEVLDKILEKVDMINQAAIIVATSKLVCNNRHCITQPKYLKVDSNKLVLRVMQSIDAALGSFVDTEVLGDYACDECRTNSCTERIDTIKTGPLLFV